MTMRADLLTKLRTASPLASLTGGRIHWLRRPRSGELSAVTLSIVGAGRAYSHRGAVDLNNPRVRCECWGETLEKAAAVADALTSAIETKETVGDTVFKGAFLEMESDPQPDQMGDGTAVLRVIRDFIVWSQPA